MIANCLICGVAKVFLFVCLVFFSCYFLSTPLPSVSCLPHRIADFFFLIAFISQYKNSEGHVSLFLSLCLSGTLLISYFVASSQRSFLSHVVQLHLVHSFSCLIWRYKRIPDLSSQNNELIQLWEYEMQLGPSACAI